MGNNDIGMINYGVYKEIYIDEDTRYLLQRIIIGALTSSEMSGIPIDKKYYNSIEKLKEVASHVGRFRFKG